ncbi:uncharacterized protein V1516DRAFT_624597 [Lipomyces oligophaga]|uniref:uncharacterized protein n=1 Tax=Lipomyces oligophaga TaxID=45792 RepID=UPI0034CFBEF8
MVSISDVRDSNQLVKSSISATPIAVFVGATSGIGRISLIDFVKYTSQPRIYIVGRSRDAAELILTELAEINSGGEYHFIYGDVSLLSTVDDVCAEIKIRERYINLLFQSQGTLDITSVTSEGFSLFQALSYYSRMRFTTNLLPLLQAAPSLRRVVTVLAGTKEGPIWAEDIPGNRATPWRARGHVASMVTLTLEQIAIQAPNISFIHDYPGHVKTPLVRTMKGVIGNVMKAILIVLPLFINMDQMPIEDSGERHVYLSTSSMYPPKEGSNNPCESGVQLPDGLEICIGTEGKSGGGVYAVDAYNEGGGAAVQHVLRQLREEGIREKVWHHLQEEFERVSRSKSSP